MISVNVRYHNILRRHVGVRADSLCLPDNTRLGQALELVVERHGPHLRDLLLSAEGGIASHLVVFCNGRLIHGDREGFQLSDGDQLMLFPATSGG